MDRESLDRHITGNYGEDQFRDSAGDDLVQDGGESDDDPELSAHDAQGPQISADWLEALAAGYEARLDEEDADRQDLLEWLIGDLRNAAANARRERS